jgi:hypothetical protein
MCSVLTALAVVLGMLAAAPALASARAHAPTRYSTGTPLREHLSRPGTAGQASARGGSAGRGHVAAGSGISAGQASAMTTAAAHARKTGRPTLVGALTTSTATTTANPSGSFTYRGYTQPVRIRRGDGWAAISPALRRAGGGYQPSAVPGQLTLAGGGTRQLARLSGGDAASLTVSFPVPLPAPAVSGDSATYRNVLPGVGLVITAQPDGGFSEVLVIHTPQAARNPALARLRLGLKAAGATLTQAGDGTVQAIAAYGQLAYSATAPLMWDTATPSAARHAVAAGGGTRAGHVIVTSSAAGPGAGAAYVSPASRLAGDALIITPPSAMLDRPAAEYPVYLAAPSIVPQAALALAGYEAGPAQPHAGVTPLSVSPQPQTATGDKQDFAPVQEGCPTAHNYNSTLSTYDDLPVGYDDWGDPCSPGVDYPYYQVGVPSQIWGGDISNATVDAIEAYSSSCSLSSDVQLDWTGGINKNTDWDDRPSTTQSNVAHDTVGPSTAWCNNTTNNNGTEPAFGLNVTSVIGGSSGEGGASSGHWSNFTFRLEEPGMTSGGDDVYLKQIKNNPSMVITYTMPSSTPFDLDAYAGSDNVGCATASPYPAMGKTASTTAPYLTSKSTDKVGSEELTFWYRYWSPSLGQNDNTNGPLGVNAQQNTYGPVELPSSFISSLADGDLVDWMVRATNGTDYTAWSQTCGFDVDPQDPDSPLVSAPVPGSNCPSSGPASGCTVSYTITQAPGDTDTEFVWDLDVYPWNNNPSASEICSTTSDTCPIVDGSATISITVPGPGPQVLWVYGKDAAGNESSTGCGATTSSPNCPSEFIAGDDDYGTFSSFNSALTADDSFDNIMITSNSDPGAASGNNGDGGGRSFSATDLTNVGWNPDSDVTVDGATFDLPDFGTGQPDNILAAGQTIDLPAGTQGGALVFLATSNNAGVTDPEEAYTGADATSPSFNTATTAFTGAGCDDDAPTITALGGQGAPPGCETASGTINYSGSSTGQPYNLTVPDWIEGPADIAAVTLPHRNTLNGQQDTQAKIFAFAVPLAQGVTVSSVTLPDVSTLVTGGTPALHIFGIAVRNTTASTPEVNGTADAAPSGQSWTGSWASPAEMSVSDSADTGDSDDWSNQSIAVAVTPSVSGSDVRIKLDDPGYQASQTSSLTIGAATIATQSNGVVPQGTPQPLTFGGSGSVTIPAGGDIYSDPVNFTVAAGQPLLVSLYLQSTNVPGMPEHTYTSQTAEWVSPAGSGNDTMATGSTATADYTKAGSLQDIDASTLLTGLDVTTSGDPTVAVLGNNLTDPATSGNTPGTPAIAQDLIADLGSTSGYGVIDTSIESNQITADGSAASGTYQGGVNALGRLDRDILDQPGIGTVIVNEGLEDLLVQGEDNAAVDPNDDLINPYEQLVTQLQEWGITVITATLTPCYGYGTESGSKVADSCTTTSDGVDVAREDVNTWITSQISGVAPPYVTAVDFNAAVGTTVSSPPSTDSLAVQLNTGAAPNDDDAGDHVNLTPDGYTNLAATIVPLDALAGYTCNLPNCPGN